MNLEGDRGDMAALLLQKAATKAAQNNGAISAVQGLFQGIDELGVTRMVTL